MIRYKVVRLDSDSRYSCYARGKYQLTYKKNTIVTAGKGTLGIAVFEKRHQAEEFIREEYSADRLLIIIRVISIGCGKRYHFVCLTQDEQNLNHFYYKHSKNLSALLKEDNTIKCEPFILSPPGSIFYQQVKVLE